MLALKFSKHGFFCFILTLGITLTATHAQVTWQTTATDIGGYNSGSCTLVNGTLRVTVFPAYLDMEEDVEIGTSGTVTTGNDPNTLEIVATFSLPAGATIIGGLLWDGERLLQGKLLDRGIADSIYEDLVNRNSTPPPRPRDPMIIELTGTNTYRLRVYPVALGHSRHFRLRYQLPPKIGVDGFEIRMQAAIIPLFTPTSNTITMSMLNGGGADSVVYVESGLKRVLTLPRSLFPTRSSLTASAAAGTSALRILPIDPLRQVAVKTSFYGGNFAGNFLNLYAGVSEDVLKELGQRIEVVIFWKWHNPATWIQHTASGEQITSYVSTAQSQASQILSLYGSLGVPGNRVGLLHDNSANEPRAFPVAANTEASYQQAVDYLRSVQGSYAEQFARGLQILPGNGGAPLDWIPVSKNSFLKNMRLVKTLYSPDQNIVRHLIMVSVGPEYATAEASLNDSINQIFSSMPFSLSTMKNWGFDQAGFDLWGARSNHAYSGTMISTSYADIPGFSATNMILTVRNELNSYDFTIPCTGGLSLICGSLEFHGKSDYLWNDSLQWKAYRSSSGVLVGATTTAPKKIAPDEDTATAILWAGSTSPFSEKKELPLGPTYGFVDKWANLLATDQDTLGNLAYDYASSGVPRMIDQNILNVIPNYDNSSSPGCGTCVAIADALITAMKNSAMWRIEHGRDGLIFVRIQGLKAGLRTSMELFDLSGKKVGEWNSLSEFETIRWNASGIRSGTYLLRIRIAGIQGVKRIAL